MILSCQNYSLFFLAKTIASSDCSCWMASCQASGQMTKVRSTVALEEAVSEFYICINYNNWITIQLQSYKITIKIINVRFNNVFINNRNEDIHTPCLLHTCDVHSTNRSNFYDLRNPMMKCISLEAKHTKYKCFFSWIQFSLHPVPHVMPKKRGRPMQTTTNCLINSLFFREI